jgi:hypothetical protein
MIGWPKTQITELVTWRLHLFEHLSGVYLRREAPAQLVRPLARADALQKYREAKGAGRLEGAKR